MAKLNSILNIGSRAMMNNQAALATVSHNVANKDTEGFSRQRTEIQSNTPQNQNGVYVGTGSKTAKVRRVNDPFIERQIMKQSSSLGFAQSQSELLSQVEQVFNESIDKGLSHHLGQFFNSFRELANSPESSVNRGMVRDSSDLLAKDFNKLDQQLRDIQERADHQIRTEVQSVNEFLQEIADLNERISRVEIGGQFANDERDRRDLLLKKLGKMIDISFAENDKGQILVSAKTGEVLVSGFNTAQLKALVDPSREGAMGIYYENHSGASLKNMTGSQKNGALAAMIKIRDQVVGGLLEKLDRLAYSLSSQVNRLHRQGVDGKNRGGGDFFSPLSSVQGAASRFGLSETVLNDIQAIAASFQMNSEGNNQIAHAIARLQHERIMGEGEATTSDFYNEIVAHAGLLAQRAAQTQASQKNVLDQLNHVRESISGVSLDEETTKMIEYQKSFAASAKLIQTADEMFDTILNMKR